ncbi:MAG TPA: hypothetical protein VES20_06475 [Bryobacteraceae bacterium]|nr:hypothetical protein [Bryobacteraceae bacterium]
MKLALAVIAAVVSADVIDRVAVAVGFSVITESEILRQIRITALLNGEQPDFSGPRKREAAERLVEQMLIRREIETTRYALDAKAESESLYVALRGRVGSEREWQNLLRQYRLQNSDVREALQWQATLLEFIQVRFHPGVQVSDEEIQQYYDDEVAKKPGAPSFDAARSDIEQVLTQQRVDRALDRWLGQTRTQNRIVFREEVFR